MRDNPNLSDAAIKDCLSLQYGLQAAEITFLPKSGDTNAAVYHIRTREGAPPYFLKLRRGAFDEIAVLLPKFLSDLGIAEIIAPMLTQNHQLWTPFGDFQVILYPFIEGHNAFEQALTQPQWINFGAALSAIHQADLPARLRKQVQPESYAPHWREKVKMLLQKLQKDTFPDPLAAQYAAVMREKSAEILYIVQRAERLCSMLQAQNPEWVLCHSDLHAGNLLIDRQGRLYIVDWDYPIFAPKERDLMFICGGIGSTWYEAQAEALFYRGYGPAEVNPVALAYYRFERIVQNLAEFAELVLFTEQGGQDRARWLMGLKRWFQPHDVVAMAYQAERLVRDL